MDLFINKVRWYWINSVHTNCILRCKSSNSGRCISAQGTNCFDVRLNSCPTTRIRAGHYKNTANHPFLLKALTRSITSQILSAKLLMKFLSSPSTITRITGSVPDSLTNILPLSPNIFSPS